MRELPPSVTDVQRRFINHGPPCICGHTRRDHIGRLSRESPPGFDGRCHGDCDCLRYEPIGFSYTELLAGEQRAENVTLKEIAFYLIGVNQRDRITMRVLMIVTIVAFLANMVAFQLDLIDTFWPALAVYVVLFAVEVARMFRITHLHHQIIDDGLQRLRS